MQKVKWGPIEVVLLEDMTDQFLGRDGVFANALLPSYFRGEGGRFETGSHYLALVVLQVTLQTSLTSNSDPSECVRHHRPALVTLLRASVLHYKD